MLVLDQSTSFAQKGENALKNGQFAQARDCYASALRLKPDLVHLQTILSGVEMTIKIRTSEERINEAHAIMKKGRYREANELFHEAISFDSKCKDSLQEVLASLVPLMQGEDAMNRQRQGLTFLENKEFDLALKNFNEAIELLPPNSAKLHSQFLADRASVHLAEANFDKAMEDSLSALAVKSDLASAHFRLGAAYFGQDKFEEAILSYEKARKCDHTHWVTRSRPSCGRSTPLEGAATQD